MAPLPRNRWRQTVGILYQRAQTYRSRFHYREGRPSILTLVMIAFGPLLLLPFEILLAICRFLFRWPRQRIKRWALCILLPVGIYYAIYLVSIPFCLAWARQIGENICAMANRGEISSITMTTPPPGIVYLGPQGAKKLRELEADMAAGCFVRVRPGNFDSYFSPGAYVLVLGGQSERGANAASFRIFYHPIWTPLHLVLGKIIPLIGRGVSLTAFKYLSFMSGDAI